MTQFFYPPRRRNISAETHNLIFLSPSPKEKEHMLADKSHHISFTPFIV